MRIYQMRICRHCGKEYLPVSPTQKYCAECAFAVNSIRNAKWHKANPEKRKASAARYYKGNEEKLKAENIKWKRENPARVRGYCVEGRAKRRGLPSDLIFLNLPFDGCDGHHMRDGVHGIYIPGSLHESIGHNYRTGRGMAEMDTLALAYAGLSSDVLNDALPFD